MARNLTIQFDGLCCHVETANGRRAIVLDASAHDHVSYVEVYPDDFDAASNPAWSFSAVYQRGPFLYQRAPVGNEKIEIVNAVTSSALMVMGSFDDRIPKLSQVEPSFTSIDADYLQATIASGKVAAFFDMSKGVLSSGPPEAFETRFDPPKDWAQRKHGQYVQLEISIDDSTPPAFRATNLSNGTSRTLVLKPGASLITFGNQIEKDILGIPGSRQSHFDQYYDLAGSALEDRPKPRQGNLGMDVGCPNSSFP